MLNLVVCKVTARLEKVKLGKAKSYLEITVFWDITSCSMVESFISEEPGTSISYPQGGGSRSL
jgi:hypothetical protein